MTGFGMMAWIYLSWAMVAPASFGRHMAEIADAFESKRAELLTKRRAGP